MERLDALVDLQLDLILRILVVLRIVDRSHQLPDAADGFLQVLRKLLLVAFRLLIVPQDLSERKDLARRALSLEGASELAMNRELRFCIVYLALLIEIAFVVHPFNTLALLLGALDVLTYFAGGRLTLALDGKGLITSEEFTQLVLELLLTLLVLPHLLHPVQLVLAHLRPLLGLFVCFFDLCQLTEESRRGCLLLSHHLVHVLSAAHI